jgi:hypothetical protein
MVRLGAKGLGKLLLPLAILLDVLDFMEAYEKTEGTKWDKTREGLWAALDSWIELPLSLFLHTMNMAMKMFGEEINVQAKLDEWMKAMKAGWDFFLTGQFINAISNFGIQLRNFFVSLINGMIEKVASAAQSTKIPGMGAFANSIRSMKMDMMYTNHPTNKSTLENSRSLRAAEMARGIDVSKIDQREKSYGVAQDNLDASIKLGEEIKKQREANTYFQQGKRALGNALGFNMGQGDVKQVPDEIDNNMVGLNVFNGSLI